jgi:hypothetical protein
LEETGPPWDYEIQTFEDLLDAVEEHKRRVACAVEGWDDYYPKPRPTAIGIEGTPAEAH